ncbi:co-chaperone GroES [Candidatus Dojkabacteria bacterium]|jgi:chaperonin GroES|uniref:Co-chaperonin GroES n=1 Tax=Candidatus Dojkabacteria bacterium TaxID=2099670 RepID=A0A955I8G3_9BACT|nr:co-chaperone GroES [Candidatus Dojkabacteria bacterium]HRN86717.1 co-chaperone GroES [Candidatus Dojkabacteria bacterium]HRO65121.1 co-chaperone GroES [Candidatus Dojkabacteria bacterium]HRP51805.1 co-chaperone GroES [Candidatus Dojkabacteria bacterium]
MAKVNLKPLGGNLLVKAIVEKSVSGIVLPDTIDKEKPQKGEVIALGTGKVAKDGKKIAFNVKVGDIVLFKKYSPDEVEVNGEDYLIMDEDAILAILS